MLYTFESWCCFISFPKYRWNYSCLHGKVFTFHYCFDGSGCVLYSPKLWCHAFRNMRISSITNSFDLNLIMNGADESTRADDDVVVVAGGRNGNLIRNFIYAIANFQAFNIKKNYLLIAFFKWWAVIGNNSNPHLSIENIDTLQWTLSSVHRRTSWKCIEVRLKFNLCKIFAIFNAKSRCIWDFNHWLLWHDTRFELCTFDIRKLCSIQAYVCHIWRKAVAHWNESEKLCLFFIFSNYFQISKFLIAKRSSADK